MKEENDVQLISRILEGDDTAFNTLVEKYQKGIHALVWRKIGDFHYAEELTQDTFLSAYKNLSTLKEPSQFAGWLYVIANHLCLNWIQRSKSKIQSLASIPMEEIEHASYNHHVLAQREADATERRHDLVKTLLEKLPESERTVITLYYLGGMKSKEIGKFLGVSVHTVTSRLQRARKRLEQEEDLLVQEILGGVYIPTGLTQNIMRQVAEMTPTPAPTGKPLLPWMAFGTATVLVFLLMLGISNQYLLRFQKPYSFEALSEPTIEIIDTPITLAMDSKPAVRTQAGRNVNTNENMGAGLRTDENVSAPNTQNNSFRSSTSQWTQAGGPQGGHVSGIFAASEKILYAATSTGIYRLSPDATMWTLINTSVPTGAFRMPMAEYDSTLYIVSSDELFASVDSGETWKGLGHRPKGDAIGLIITDATQSSNPHVDIVMYLALQDKGVFRSTNAGAQWHPFNNGLANKHISAVAAIKDTVFVGTNEGLYHLDSGGWRQLPMDVSGAVHSLAAMENNLYVGTGPDLSALLKDVERTVDVNDLNLRSMAFRSNDLGKSWTEITPISKSSFLKPSTGMKILAVGQSLLIQDFELFRSRDGGQTWINLGFDASPFILNNFQAVAVNENIYYKVDAFGIHRTTDSGESWHPFMNGIVGTGIRDLVAFDNKLYVHTGKDVVQSTNSGESWENVPVDIHEHTFELIGKEDACINFPFDSKLTVADRSFYVIVPETDNLRILTLSTINSLLSPVPEIPVFDNKTQSVESMLSAPETLARAGGFAVGNGTFYVEYKRELFRWRLGDSEWINTGLLDTSENLGDKLDTGFKLAVSGKTVYVGKRAGHLFQSQDAGNSWRDITSNLPLRFSHFNEIFFVGSTVYVATDTGVLSSENGESWRVLTDGTGMRITIDRFAVDGTTVYGAGDTGLYRLDTRGHWKQISPSVPDKVLSLVISNDRLYIATQQHGIFHRPLGEEYRNELSQR
ncbi:sigma-70 family RNA polymerase sigma factor [Candidatus Poribacteria bacterium]|nr:sigma-70 family RNA polymerase sigma factor [Candidatus Poribacteria bacterium]